MTSPVESLNAVSAIAIIGMAGRFPGAPDLDIFWQNLRNGVESITFFSQQELIEAGIDPEIVQDPSYVKASGILDDVEMFDASFFGVNPREAEATDPQHRLFLECAWRALEQAGYCTDGHGAVVGLYAGVGASTYLLNLMADTRVTEALSPLQIRVGNDKDFLPTRVSYRLNLTGPSVAVQTACSTSLVAVHMACQSLLNGECDLALAGGARIRIPGQAGYWYREGGIMSPDGHCRAFDAGAQGTVGGDGVGVVVLKRLDEALADRDSIQAIIKGSAVNNDGADKVGYTAPSVSGQSGVIREALDMATVAPETVAYIEAHGTGTPLGDPIEIAALTRAFRAHTAATGFCAVGSVKTNIGHLDTAAGIAGLIKTVLALQNRMLPPSLHYQEPNPQIDFAHSPFYVNATLSEWPDGQLPRRAGVSSFGIGGTNAHVVLEEAPAVEPSESSRPYHLVTLSAKTPNALQTATQQFAQHVKTSSEMDISDVAYTLLNGRKGFNYRRMVVCRDLVEAVERLDIIPSESEVVEVPEGYRPAVVFMFPGQGTQFPNMASELYHCEPVFRQQINHCAESLGPYLHCDLRELLYPVEGKAEWAQQQLQQTCFTQPALFATEYALAKLWMSWGVEPEVMIGHSIGEYVAACLAGVFTLEAASGLVAARGRLMQQLPAGDMLAVALSESEVESLLSPELCLAAVNAPALCVVSGPRHTIAECETELVARGVMCRRLHTSHAFHSSMLAPIVEPFTSYVAQMDLHPPHTPLVSNVTGRLMTPAEATDSNYWGRQLRQPVRFAQGVAALMTAAQRLYLEVGPGQTLTTLVRQQSHGMDAPQVFASLPAVSDTLSDCQQVLTTLGQLWLAGVPVDGAGVYAHERRHRLPLPTYPFERQRYWVESPVMAPTGTTPFESSTTPDFREHRRNISEWFYVPKWVPTPLSSTLCDEVLPPEGWLVWLDDIGVGESIVKQLRHCGQTVITVRAGPEFESRSRHDYILNPESDADYEALCRALQLNDHGFSAMLHLGLVTESSDMGRDVESAERIQVLGLHSVLSFIQAFGKTFVNAPLHLMVVGNEVQAVVAADRLNPAKATILGPCQVIPQEYPRVTCQCLDIPLSLLAAESLKLVDILHAEYSTGQADVVVAYRVEQRFVRTVEPVPLPPPTAVVPPLHHHGVYLITGGRGGIGRTLAGYLAQQVQAKLVLLSRSDFPVVETWDEWLATHEVADAVSQMIQTIRLWESWGAEVLLLSADVADLTQMQAVVEQVESQFGQIHGVIHAAGVPDGAVIARRTREMTDSILSPKVRGSLILEHVLQGRNLDFWVSCSSLASVLAPFGQVAYVAANAFQDAYARAKSTFANRVISVNWDTWQDIGMAAKANQSEAQIVSHPLFDECRVEAPNRMVYISRFRLDTHWVVRSHQIGGRSVLPGTAYVEMARAAYAHHTGEAALELRQVYFLTPLWVDEGEEKEVHTILQQTDDGEFSFVVMSRPTSRQQLWQEHARGEIFLLESAPGPVHDLAAIARDCEGAAAEPIAFQPRTPPLDPRWQTVQTVQWTDQQGLADLVLPASCEADLLFYELHPALLDTATGFLMQRCQDEAVYLPFSYQRVAIRAPLPRRIWSYSRCRAVGAESKETLQFDLTIMDERGTELIVVDGYTLRKADLAQPVESQAEDQLLSLPGQNYRVEIETLGDLRTLTPRPVPRRKPSPGEVEIAVGAAGLNFKDVLRALGILASEDGVQLQLGLECAGRIIAVGDGVETFTVGDEVIALGSSCFSPFVTTAATSVMRKPPHLNDAEAATIPIASLTAYYALIYLGRLQRDDRILIHAAAGGVGLAAVQIARWIGAKVFATAGSPEKRDYLQQLGVEAVMDSRSLAFAGEVMERTSGAGVDMVLNSLAGEFIPKSFSVLAPYGRFLEIGTRDIDHNSQLALQPFEKSLSFFAVKIGPQMPQFRTVWNEVMQLFESKALQPLRYRAVPVTDIDHAFDEMANARHIGKIVLTFPSVEIPEPENRVDHRDTEPVGLTARDGIEVFRRILGASTPQVLVSTKELIARITHARERRVERFQEAFERSEPMRGGYQRPALKTAYVAPRHETEVELAEIWQELLGIESIGIHDHFLELGGHSLLGIQILSRVRTRFQLELPIALLFETPTIAAQAEVIAQSQSEPIEALPDRIGRVERGEAGRLLEQMEQLSDAEVEAFLRARLQQGEGEGAQ